MTIEGLKQYPDAKVVFCNTGKENEQTLIFVNNVDEYIGNKITWLQYNSDSNIWFDIVNYKTAARNGEPFESLIKKRKYLPNIVARFCTQDLKIRPLKKYCQRVLGWDHWVNMVGIRYDEPNRWNKSKSVERNEVFDVYHPLVKWKITKKDVIDYWKKMPFDLNIKDYEGNCDLCFLKGKKKKMAIARTTPEKYEWWMKMETLTNSRFVNDYSYAALLDKIKKAPELFDYDDDIECFCNID